MRCCKYGFIIVIIVVIIFLIKTCFYTILYCIYRIVQMLNCRLFLRCESYDCHMIVADKGAGCGVEA